MAHSPPARSTTMDMQPSKSWPDFLKLARACEVDQDAEKVCRDVVGRVSQKMPVRCLREVCEAIADYVRRENQDLISEN